MRASRTHARDLPFLMYLLGAAFISIGIPSGVSNGLCSPRAMPENRRQLSIRIPARFRLVAEAAVVLSRPFLRMLWRVLS